jgi:hypothetical protein
MYRIVAFYDTYRDTLSSVSIRIMPCMILRNRYVAMAVAQSRRYFGSTREMPLCLLTYDSSAS